MGKVSHAQASYVLRSPRWRLGRHLWLPLNGLGLLLRLQPNYTWVIHLLTAAALLVFPPSQLSLFLLCTPR